MSINPLANRPRADACGFGNGLRRLSARDLPYNALSTARRQPGILMHVHPVLPWNLKLQQPQLPRSEPDGQPTESSQLDRLLAGVLAPFAQRYMVLARRALGPGDAGGSGDRCNARATQSNRARGHFLQDKAKMSKRGVLLRSWLACSSLLKGATGCGGLGSHIGVKERS